MLRLYSALSDGPRTSYAHSTDAQTMTDCFAHRRQFWCHWRLWSRCQDHSACELNRRIAEPYARKDRRNSKSLEIGRNIRSDRTDWRRHSLDEIVISCDRRQWRLVCSMGWQSCFTSAIYLITALSLFAGGWSLTTPPRHHNERLRVISAATASSRVPDSGHVTPMKTTNNSMSVGT